MSNTWWRDPDELKKQHSEFLDIATDQDLLISGPPGSGKTNLLLLRANQLYLGDRPNLFIAVFGSLLKHFIRLGAEQYHFPVDKVTTHTQLFINILSAEGVQVETDGLTLMEARVKRAATLKKLMDEKVVSTQFDALLLDEAQDYLPQEIELLRRLTDVLVATADSRQRIYDVADCSSTLSQHIANCYPLIYHFRNGLDICRVADGIMKGTSSYSPMVDRSNYDENAYPSKVKPRAGLSIEQQAAAIAEQIREQRFAYPTELIGVLCPRNDEVDAIEAGLQAAGLGPLITRANKGLQFDPTRPIWLSTLTAAKGLEFRAVHIAGLDHLARMGSVQKRLIYTGVTRAKTALTLYWESQIPGYLDTALRQVDSSTRVVTKQNLFGMS